jgi:hypothetical protein
MMKHHRIQVELIDMPKIEPEIEKNVITISSSTIDTIPMMIGVEDTRMIRRRRNVEITTTTTETIAIEIIVTLISSVHPITETTIEEMIIHSVKTEIIEITMIVIDAMTETDEMMETDEMIETEEMTFRVKITLMTETTIDDTIQLPPGLLPVRLARDRNVGTHSNRVVCDREMLLLWMHPLHDAIVQELVTKRLAELEMTIMILPFRKRLLMTTMTPVILIEISTWLKKMVVSFSTRKKWQHQEIWAVSSLKVTRQRLEKLKWLANVKKIQQRQLFVCRPRRVRSWTIKMPGKKIGC